MSGVSLSMLESVSLVVVPFGKATSIGGLLATEYLLQSRTFARHPGSMVGQW
jgi:hypothetical protein